MENLRKPISKKLRFEIFKRDDFTCQYCSSKPPKVPLEIDHITPVSKGGKNSIDNLITACFDCNRGKSNNELTNLPITISEKNERIKIAHKQYLEYKNILKKQDKILSEEIDEIELIFNLYFNEFLFNEKFKSSVRSFINKIGFYDVKDAMNTACTKIYFDQNKALKYFCGICWNKIKNN